MSSSLVGKACPDAPFTSLDGKTKSSLSKLAVKGKSTVLCLVSSGNAQEAKAALALMEDTAFRHADKTTFVVVSTDSNANAVALNADVGGVKKCAHVVATAAAKPFAFARVPFVVVVGADGKVKYAAEGPEGAWVAHV